MICKKLLNCLQSMIKIRKEYIMQKKTVLRIIILALIVVWMITVFGLSNQNGEKSSSLSRLIASKIVKTEEQIDIIEPYIRKLAHLSEYAIRWNIILIIIFNI